MKTQMMAWAAALALLLGSAGGAVWSIASAAEGGALTGTITVSCEDKTAPWTATLSSSAADVATGAHWFADGIQAGRIVVPAGVVDLVVVNDDHTSDWATVKVVEDVSGNVVDTATCTEPSPSTSVTPSVGPSPSTSLTPTPSPSNSVTPSPSTSVTPTPSPSVSVTPTATPTVPSELGFDVFIDEGQLVLVVDRPPATELDVFVTWKGGEGEYAGAGDDFDGLWSHAFAGDFPCEAFDVTVDIYSAEWDTFFSGTSQVSARDCDGGTTPSPKPTPKPTPAATAKPKPPATQPAKKPTIGDAGANAGI